MAESSDATVDLAGSRLADRVWARDLCIATRALSVDADGGSTECGSTASDEPCIAVRLRAGEDAVRVLQGLAENRILEGPVRVLIDLHEAGAPLGGLAQWLSDEGFEVLSICRDHQRWSRLDALDRDCDNGGAPDALYAFRDVEVHAVSVFMHMTALGGGERSFLEWGADLVADGHLVHAYLPALDGPLVPLLQDAGITCSAHGTGWWFGVWEEGRWTDAAVGMEVVVSDLGRHRPDILITQTVVVPSGALSAKALGIPHAWWVHERPDPQYGLYAPAPRLEDLGEAMSALSDGLIANSRFVADAYWPGQDVAIIAPIRIPKVRHRGELAFAPKPTRSQGRPRIAVVGSVTPGKGQTIVLDAVADLRARAIDVTVRFIGAGTDAELTRLADRAEALGVADLVEGPDGWVDPSEIYQGLDGVVVASWGEGFGRVAVEAITAGVPVVYSDSGGMREFMQDGATGIAFQPRDARSLADAVQRLLADESLRQRLADEALPALVARLGPFDPRARLPELITDLLAARGAGKSSWADEAAPRLAVGAARPAAETAGKHREQVQGLEQRLERAEWDLLQARDECLGLRAEAEARAVAVAELEEKVRWLRNRSPTLVLRAKAADLKRRIQN